MSGRMMICAAVFLCIWQACAGAKGRAVDDIRFNDAVLVLTGAGEIEDVDESELDRYMRLASNPLGINSAGRASLLSSGLLTLYQVVSLLDYRARNGDVMSF